jgi:hypothetical protein
MPYSKRPKYKNQELTDFLKGITSDEKIVILLEKDNEVELLVDLLRRKGHSCIGLNREFQGEDRVWWFFRHVKQLKLIITTYECLDLFQLERNYCIYMRDMPRDPEIYRMLVQQVDTSVTQFVRFHRPHAKMARDMRFTLEYFGQDYPQWLVLEEQRFKEGFYN